VVGMLTADHGLCCTRIFKPTVCSYTVYEEEYMRYVAYITLTRRTCRSRDNVCILSLAPKNANAVRSAMSATAALLVYCSNGRLMLWQFCQSSTFLLAFWVKMFNTSPNVFLTD